MLVLTRKTSESIVITLPDGTHIHVLVQEVRGDKVRLAFQAGKDVVIHRLEVFNAIENEKTP